jgi:transcriptional regulator with XRE-family HTH domain
MRGKLLKRIMMIDVEVGNRIKNIRSELKLKGIEFAEKLEISAPKLSDLENGKTKPGFDLIVKFKETFNVNFDYLLLGEGPIFYDSSLSPKFTVANTLLKSEELEDFLYYFENSSMVQYSIMNEFRRKKFADGDLIKREIEAKMKEKK